jgi:hypothetical protein
MLCIAGIETIHCIRKFSAPQTLPFETEEAKHSKDAVIPVRQHSM